MLKAPLFFKHFGARMPRSSPLTRPSNLFITRSFLSINDTQDEIPSPLIDLKNQAQSKRLCDENGFRRPDTHWSFVISASATYDQAPSTRTVNFQRISPEGIEFVSKNKSDSIFDHNRPVSFLYTEGKYKPGHKVVQWRGDGICQKIDLEEVLEYVPEYSISEIIASCRARKEIDNTSDRMSIQGLQSKFTEIVQETRADFVNSNISPEELKSCIQAWRFVPENLEKMMGGPDEIMWERWEFSREEGSSNWREPRQLMPY
mmetsp:Transcript_22393/g.33134  ORF Transcript_22393/g.33134 Transcript_22393/m.33134 type:complete len:260 (-) Transcript_22393:74-853(-)